MKMTKKSFAVKLIATILVGAMLITFVSVLVLIMAGI